MDAERSQEKTSRPEGTGMSAAISGVLDLLDGQPTLAAARGIAATALDSIYGVGRELYANGHHVEALRSFEMLCLYDHQNPRNWQALGTCRQALQDYGGAAAALAFAIGQLPEPGAGLRVSLVECLVAVGALDAAEDHLVALSQDTALDDSDGSKVAFLKEQIQHSRGAGPSAPSPTEQAGAEHG